MKKILILLIPVLFSCTASNINKNNCEENMKFKEIFLYHVNYIETNITISQDSKFRKSVIFISNYAPVSLEHIANYSTTYPVGIFKQDRLNWIGWYEDNKCNNIQFKDSLVIPEVYQGQ